jgi:hypothetical protein
MLHSAREMSYVGDRKQCWPINRLQSGEVFCVINMAITKCTEMIDRLGSRLVGNPFVVLATVASSKY